MQTLTIKTNIHCPPAQLEYRRKDIITQAIDVLGRDGAHDLFHNHQGEKAIRRYPLIQYRVHDRKLQIFAVGEAVPVLMQVIVKAELDNTAHRINLNNVEMTTGKASLIKSDRYQYYRLMDWVALNNDTFNNKWKKTFSMIERIPLLDQAITGHLRILGSQFMDDEESQKMDGVLYMVNGKKPMKVYGNTMMGLNVLFKTRYILPEGFALGRCISLGAGTFQMCKTNPEEEYYNEEAPKKSKIVAVDEKEQAERRNAEKGVLNKIVL